MSVKRDVSAVIQAYLDGPSCPPPDGVTVNLDSPANKNGEAIAVGAICILLTTAAIFMRAYSRLFVVKEFRIEDYIGILAFIPWQVPYIGLCWCYFDYVVNIGFFVHQWDLRGKVLIDMGYNSFVIGFAYSLLMLLIKNAILIEWIRIFVPLRTRNAFYWASTILIGLNTMIYLSAIFSEVGSCRPLDKLWHFWVAGSCINRKARDTINAAFNLGMDIFILVLPQRIIWGLNMHQSRKIGVAAVFSVGLLVVAIASGRLYSTIILDYPDDLTHTFDTSYQFSQTLLWAFAEVACVFLVFSVPTVPKIFSEQRLGSRIANSWRSWTRLSAVFSSKNSKYSKNNNTPPGSDLPASKYYIYRGENGAWAPDTTHSSVSLEELMASQKHALKINGGDQISRVHQSSGGGILKTVEFNRHDEPQWDGQSPYPGASH